VPVELDADGIEEFVEELRRVFGGAYHHLVPRAAPA